MNANNGHLAMSRVGYMSVTSRIAAEAVPRLLNAGNHVFLPDDVYYRSRSGICKSSPGSIRFMR